MTDPAMRSLIARLFREGPKMTDASGKEDASQAPALACMIVLRASVPPFEGILSTTPEGTLRLMSTITVQSKPVLVEQFFTYEDVVSIVLQRVVKTSAGSGAGLSGLIIS